VDEPRGLGACVAPRVSCQRLKQRLRRLPKPLEWAHGGVGMYRRHKLAAALISSGLCGCGLTVPQVGEFWDRDYPGDPTKGTRGTPMLTATAQIEYEIKQKVYCELRYAVQYVDPVGVQPHLIPYGWGVQMQLSLEVDESIALTPGLSFPHLYPNVVKIFGVSNSVTTAQSFSLGLGGALSREALRTDKFNTYYSIQDLVQKQTGVCQSDGKPDPKKDPFVESLHWTPAQSSPLLIESDLGIKNWLVGATFFDYALPSSSPQPQPSPASIGKFEGKFEGKLEGQLKGQATGTFEGKTSGGGSPQAGRGGGGGGGGAGGFAQDSFSQELKFIIVSSGNIQPTWKLVQVSANTGNTPFFSTGRTRTHDLLITIGPPTTRTANDFLASQIGQAINQNVPASAQ
jgi:hypothetical protein